MGSQTSFFSSDRLSIYNELRIFYVTKYIIADFSNKNTHKQKRMVHTCSIHSDKYRTEQSLGTSHSTYHPTPVITSSADHTSRTREGFATRLATNSGKLYYMGTSIKLNHHGRHLNTGTPFHFIHTAIGNCDHRARTRMTWRYQTDSFVCWRTKEEIIHRTRVLSLL